MSVGIGFPVLRTVILLFFALLLSATSGCGGGSASSDSSPTSEANPEPTTSLSDDPAPVDPAPVDPAPPPENPIPPLAVPQLTGMETVSEDLWDETAVRKVLHTFAFGGHATDAQISTWAAMRPDLAIAQMLTFDQHNLLLSPVGPKDYDRLDTRDGTLRGLAEFWASDNPDNGIYPPTRPHYDQYDPAGQQDRIWTRAASSRGLNPFRHRIGLWETNYHMATRSERRVVIRYYDAIMGALETGRPYHEVLAEAAKSAAVAIMYGHHENIFRNGECLCNEDFAREYHQLFFGILGNTAPDYHETVSIKNTAAALTDMKVALDPVFGGHVTEVTFGTELHTPGALEILNVGIGGSDAAQRLDELSRIAIEHPESLDNLPVKIIGGLADDNLTDSKISRIRSAWQSMDQKNLLDFLHAYAISTLFHNASRIKYRTSFDRHLLIASRFILSNEESYLDIYNPLFGPLSEGVRVFRPLHHVFGGQTGEEASSSSDIFRKNFNGTTEESYRLEVTSVNRYDRSWERDWGSVVPRSATGYVVQEVAEWLWQHFLADGLKHFGPLERAHLYALLGAGVDLAYVLDSDDINRVVTTEEVQANSTIKARVDELAQRTMHLDSSNTNEQALANRHIGQAINFIVGTPFMFTEEGR